MKKQVFTKFAVVILGAIATLSVTTASAVWLHKPVAPKSLLRK